jgi:hypothetical protein
VLFRAFAGVPASGRSPSPSDPERVLHRAKSLALFLTALIVAGVGLALQHLSPRLTLLIFAQAVGAGILAAASILIRPAENNATAPNRPLHDD